MRVAKYLFALATVWMVFPSGCLATTWSVGPDGSDAASGSSGAPFRTISRAASVARAGDEIHVASGRYAETITLSSRHDGVSVRGVGPTPPVIDGEGRRAYGFHSVAADGATISGFELTGQTDAAVYLRSGRNALIANNTIHHVGSAAEAMSNGIRVARSLAPRIAGNTIHHVGPGLSSIGIWLVETRGAVVENNTVYLVRKEGVRDWRGLDNAILRNRTFLSWVGLSLNTSTGGVVEDNYSYDNVQGIVVKHASSPEVLRTWSLPSGRITRVAQNTVFRSTEASLWVAQSGAPVDHLHVRGNLFSGAGAAYLRDRPELRGRDVVVDGNAYSDEGGEPRWLYKAGYTSDPGLTDWASVRRRTGWETSPASADAGAGSLHAAPVTWTPYAMSAVDSSSKDTWSTRTHLGDTADNDQSTYWITETNKDEHVVFDLGQRRSFDHIILTVYSHDDLRNVRGYRFEVSDDGRSWQTVAAGTNPDPGGASHYYELGSIVAGRYLRMTLVDTFCKLGLTCGESFVLSDVKTGLLEPAAPQVTRRPSQLVVRPRAGLGRRAVRFRVTCIGPKRGTARFTVMGIAPDETKVRLGRRELPVRDACGRRTRVRIRRDLLPALRRGRLSDLRVTTVPSSGQPSTTFFRLRR